MRPIDLGYALVAAIEDGKDEIALVLIDAGADANVYRPNPEAGVRGPPLRQTLMRRKNVELVLALLDADADPNSSIYLAERRTTPLQLAAEWGDMRVIKALLDVGADPNYIGDFPHGGSDALLNVAVKRQDLELIEFSLKARADVNNPAARTLRKTALHAATTTGNVHIVRLLLSKGADPQDDPAIRFAARPEDKGIFNMILEKHVERYPNGCLGFGSCILEFVIDYKDTDTIDKMLRKGADPYQMRDNSQKETIKWGLKQLNSVGYAITKDRGNPVKLAQLFLSQGRCDPNSIVSRRLFSDKGLWQ